MRPFLAICLLALAGCADAHGARVRTFKIHSTAVKRTVEVRTIEPAGGGRGRPVVIFLHGRGSEPGYFTGDQAILDGLKKLGARAPILAFPYGGDHSYWHDRKDGKWGRYVLREVIPEILGRTGADPDRIAIGGISMGGFGAYDIAERADREFCAVGGHSAAVWRSAGETAPGAFDDAADFRRHDVIAHAGRLKGTPLWLDTGASDPFLPGDRTLARAAGITLHTWPGGHETSYWDRHWARYLRFYARACATSPAR